MEIIQDFVGHAHAIQIVIDYDVSIVCPLNYYKCFFIITMLGQQ